MCLSTRKLFKICGVNASYVCEQESCLKVVVSMHHVFHNKKFKSCGVNASCRWCLAARKNFKSCGVNALCVCQQESSLKFVVSMHHVFVNKEAVYK